MERTIAEGGTEVSSSDRIRTISLLYNGAVNFMQIAKRKLEQGDSYGKDQYIRKTSAIIKELAGSLNMDAGDIALNLRRLYDFVLTSLDKAENQNDLTAIEDAEKVILILQEAWREMRQASASQEKI
jgi:flagellar protein FliS